jgi:hypothetical protein
VADIPLVAAVTAASLDDDGDAGDEARASLAEDLMRISAAAADLSDRISRRYFALIDSDTQALAT